MGDWQVGLSTGCFYRQSIFDVLETVKDGGFTLLELSTYPAHLDYRDQDLVRRAAARIDELGMEVLSLHAPFGRHIDISALDENTRRRSIDELVAALDAARILGAPYMVMHPAPELDRFPSDTEMIARLHQAASSAAVLYRAGRERDVKVAFENMAPHVAFGRIRDVLWILGSLDEKQLYCCLDTGHANLAREAYTAPYKLGRSLAVIHANDNDDRTDAHFPPGRGTLRWDKIISALDEVGFRGAFIIELAEETGKPPRQVMQEARAARAFIRSICRRSS